MKNKLNSTASAFIIGVMSTLLIIGIMASKPAPSSPSSSLTFVTSRDGISVYTCGTFTIVKTDKGVSIAK